mgnify:CR=1 FL=1
MLHIVFGDIWDFNERYGTEYKVLRNIDSFFDSHYEVDWLNNDWSKRAISEIDKSNHIQDHMIESPYLGIIPPVRLSGGVKTLITMKNYNKDEEGPIIFYGNNMGENCARLLAELSNGINITSDTVGKDIWINITYWMGFPLTDQKVDVIFEGINKRVNTTCTDLDDAFLEAYCEWNLYMDKIIPTKYPEVIDSDYYEYSINNQPKWE